LPKSSAAGVSSATKSNNRFVWGAQAASLSVSAASRNSSAMDYTRLTFCSGGCVSRNPNLGSALPCSLAIAPSRSRTLESFV
jgi:hypothetical protein